MAPNLRSGPGSLPRRAVTLSETLVALAAVGLAILVLALGTDGVRTELKRKQCAELAQSLHRALLAYHQSTGGWPAGSQRPAESSADPLTAGGVESGTRVLGELARLGVSRTVLAALPEALRADAGGAAGEPELKWASVVDPWGNPLICLTSTSPLAAQRKAVAANRGCPIFISAGPDGRFGLNDPSAASDNIRSDETGN